MSTSARSNRTSLRIAGSGVAAAALVGSSLVLAPHAAASVEECGDAAVTYVSNGDYCEIRFSDPDQNGQDANSWEVPAGVTSIDLLVVGGGGGGGGGAGGGSVTGSPREAGGGGGGGGGVAVLTEQAQVTPGETISVDVGRGGSSGNGGQAKYSDALSVGDGSNGGAGSQSEVSGGGLATTLTGAGGGGGLGAKSAASNVDTTPPTPAQRNLGGEGGVGRRSASGGGGSAISAKTINFGTAGSGGDAYSVADEASAGSPFADPNRNVVVAGGGAGGVFAASINCNPGSPGGADGLASGGSGGAALGAAGGRAFTAGGGGGGGAGQSSNSDVVSSGGAGGVGADGIVVIRYAAFQDSPGGDGNAGGGGGAPAPAAPAVAAPAAPSPAFVPGGAVPTIARALVNGELADLTVTPLVNQAPESANADREAALPESFRSELPGPNGIQVTAGDVGVSLVGPQVGWPRSPDVLVVAPDVPLALQTSGFSANTEVEVFVLNQGGTWVLADTLTTGPDGTLDASVTIPEDAPVGPGYLQLDGTDASGQPISLAIGAQIAPPVAPVPTADGPLPQATPGEASATDFEGNPLVFSVDRVDGTDVQIRVGESLTSIQALDADGLQQLGPDGAIEIEEEGFVRVGGEGFQPNSMVQVWAFSEATFVGIVLTDEKGAYTSLLELPEELELGDHTLQNSGSARDGQPLAVSAGLRIIAPGEGSSAETETQETARANTTVYFGRGSSTLDAADKKKLDRLVRRVKDSAQRVRVTGYVQASSTTANDQSLSLARARSVANYLRSQGVDAKFTVRGRGVLDAPSDEARSARVTVVYTK